MHNTLRVRHYSNLQIHHQDHMGDCVVEISQKVKLKHSQKRRKLKVYCEYRKRSRARPQQHTRYEERETIKRVLQHFYNMKKV